MSEHVASVFNQSWNLLRQRVAQYLNRRLACNDIANADPYLVRFAITVEQDISISDASLIFVLRSRAVEAFPERVRIALKQGRPLQAAKMGGFSTTYWRIDKTDIPLFIYIQAVLQSARLWDDYEAIHVMADVRSPDLAEASMDAQWNPHKGFRSAVKHIPLSPMPTDGSVNTPFAQVAR